MERDCPDTELFINLCSIDHMSFVFKTMSYEKQLEAARKATGSLCAMKVYHVKEPAEYVRAVQVFAFMGGSLGCAEGEKLSRACEYCVEHQLPLVVEAASGGVRMQEGTVALMQMANTTTCIEGVKLAGLPVIIIIKDPCYGGTSGSFATLGDLTFGIRDSRFGFAGQNVIKNTMFSGSEEAFDRSVPPGFQTTDRAASTGAIDQIYDSLEDAYDSIHGILKVLQGRKSINDLGAIAKDILNTLTDGTYGSETDTQDSFASQESFVYRDARNTSRPQPSDYLTNLVTVAACLRIDKCINVTFGSFMDALPVIAITTARENVIDLEAGLGSPIGYRFAARTLRFADRLGVPVITLVDTAGALPSPDAEEQCQSRAISECLLAFQAVSIPIISVITGEGGSGGALALAGGNYVGILSKAFYNVISPEGAASILQPSIYCNNVEVMKSNFLADAEMLAHVQKCYPIDLKNAGIVTSIISGPGCDESRGNCKDTSTRLATFIVKMLIKCSQIRNLKKHRNSRYRNLSVFGEISQEKAMLWLTSLKEERCTAAAETATAAKNKQAHKSTEEQQKHIAELQKVASYLTNVAHTKGSKLYDALTIGVAVPSPELMQAKIVMPEKAVANLRNREAGSSVTCKMLLREQGPDAVCRFIMQSGRLFYTDTTFRDAHQSILATRLRTRELIEGALLLQQSGILTMKDTPLFSVECWGGATFDTAMRFLDENPYERLRFFNEAMPNTLTQMLLRGANAVGYTSYSNDVIKDFIVKTASAGLDVFRVFDAFNNLQQMETAVDTILSKCRYSLCEICICFTGDFLSTTRTEEVYTLEYYREVARSIAAKWPQFHILCIKDMAGLVRPAHARPLVAAIRDAIGPSKPIHFHTHDTSGAGLCTCLAMAQAGCNIVDLASSSLAGLTSQPPLQTFIQLCSSEEKTCTDGRKSNDSCARLFNLSDCCSDVVDVLSVYDSHWRLVRQEHKSLDTNFASPSADIYRHEIPGGQISNLYQQCCNMGLEHRWNEAMDAYAQCNAVLGSLIKVTPSSKVVGDLALFILTKNLSINALKDEQRAKTIDWPDSLVNLLKGKLGLPHHGFPIEIVRNVLKLSTREAEEHLAHLRHMYTETQVQERRLLDETNDNCASEDTFSKEDAQRLCSNMYPKQFEQYCERREKYSDLLHLLPASVYCRGLTVKESCAFLLDRHTVGTITLLRAHNKNFQQTERKFDYSIELHSISDDTIEYSDLKQLTFKPDCVTNMQKVESQKYTCVHRYSVDGGNTCPMAEANNDAHVAASIPGVVEKLLVMVGQEVKKGDALLRIGSAKLDIVLTAQKSGRINQIMCQQSMPVMPGSLLLVMD